jgi:hypothetical protein
MAVEPRSAAAAQRPAAGGADALAVQLRPRPMYEAADLGVRLVQAHARSVWRCWWPVWGSVAVLAVAAQSIHGWLPWTVLFVLKPWLDRTLLFVLSRAVFGQETRFADLWHARRAVWWGQLLSTLTARRLSFWRAFTQPVVQLEGLRGAALRQRLRQLCVGRRGKGAAVQAAFWQVESSLTMAVPVLALWLMPGAHVDPLLTWFTRDGGQALTWIANIALALAVGFVEPFFVGAGFAMYLNRRVELEAWDVEQEFRHAFAA